MKANELRIGNLILAKGNVETLTGIYQEGIKSKGGKIFGIYEIGSIRLTEEWLLKFGFEKKQKGNLYFDRNMDLIIFGDEYDYNGLFIGRIDSVHQLQNLYFALTGDELTIKPE